MGLTIPAELTSVAALVGGGVAELFTVDEDNVKAIGNTIGAFTRQAIPALDGTEQAATRFTTATSGPTRDTFAGHWNTLAANGHTGKLLHVAERASTVLTVTAEAIRTVKIAALGWLTACAAQLAIAAVTAATGGLIITVRAILHARTSINAVTRRLFTHLRGAVANAIRRASNSLRTTLEQLGNLGPHSRLAFSGPSPAQAGGRGGNRMNADFSKRGWRGKDGAPGPRARGVAVEVAEGDARLAAEQARALKDAADALRGISPKAAQQKAAEAELRGTGRDN
ncbi:hypothetical protein [Nonomuraea sp. NPDC048916]|uniref:hypothetical protein n=1 Tax=Nonomuraea sp. NPDC048916 TaxID=3154232 RepID=UPI0033EF7864